MPTGFLVNNACYETAPAAADAYFSSQSVVTFPHPTALNARQSVQFDFVAPNWMRSTYDEFIFGKFLFSQTVAVSPVFPPCLAPSESYSQGLIFGSATALLLLFAFATRAISRILS